MEDLKKLKQIEFEQREKRLEKSFAQKLVYNPKTREKLNITYVMTWTGICGGTKIILEHANRLTEKGHKINLISHDKKPDWFPLDSKVNFIQVPWGEVLCESIPSCDVIIATYWREIFECVEQKIAPVVYFEQGDYHLFDMDKLDKRVFNYINNQLKTTKFIFTVSSFAKQKLKEIYNADASVIPNAVDSRVFYYEQHHENKVPAITVIGSEKSEFKRIKNIIKAVDIIKNKGYHVKLNWITPNEPENLYGNVIVNPPQKVIGDTLRNTDIFVCASMYESFCLPVLEAMSCGATVVTTNNGGNMDFVKDNENAIIIEKDNIEDMTKKIELLLNNKSLRNKIALNGQKNSERYSWENTIKQLEDYYYEITNYEVVKEN